MRHDEHTSGDTSAPVRPRRLEIITGQPPRRMWAPEAKAKVVAESLAPGAVVAVVARRHAIAPQQLHSWRRLAREGALVLPADAPAFVPLIAAAAPLPPPRMGAAKLEIELAGAIVRMTAEGLADLIDIFTALRRSP